MSDYLAESYDAFLRQNEQFRSRLRPLEETIAAQYADNVLLEERLAEAERLLRAARDMIRAGIDDYDGVQEDALVGRIEAALAGAAVQPDVARCERETGVCVMVHDPDREPCTPENCQYTTASPTDGAA